MCHRSLLLILEGTLIVAGRRVGRSRAAQLRGRHPWRCLGWDAPGESLVPTSSITMTVMLSGAAFLLEASLGSYHCPLFRVPQAKASDPFLDRTMMTSQCRSPVGGVVLVTQIAVGRLLYGLVQFVGLLVCSVAEVEVICGGDRCLGHLGANG